MTLAILCSGQGPQHPEMFKLTADVPAAAPVFELAAALLGGRDPRELVRTGSFAELHGDCVGQVLCAVQALTITAALQDCWPTRRVIAGYSAGELGAWGVAGLLDPKDVLGLAAQRADQMDAVSVPGDGLLFVRGLSRTMLERLCDHHGAAIAIVNPNDAYVVGGAGSALDAMAVEMQAQSATHVVRLPVEVASHTSRLADASRQFRQSLAQAPMHWPLKPGVRLLSGTDGQAVSNLERGQDKLAAQISHTIAWADCLQACFEAGASAFLELGPGKALSDMVAGAWPGTPARSIEEFKTLQGVRDWLAAPR